MHMYWQPAAIYFDGSEIELLIYSQIHHADYEVQTTNKNQKNGEQSRLTLAKGGYVQFVTAYDRRYLRKIELLQTNTEGNEYALGCFARRQLENKI